MSEGHRPARWSGKRSVPAVSTRSARTTPPAPAAPTVDATDAARALAAEHNIDLATIEHSGDRITKGDVDRHIADQQTEPEPEPTTTEPEPELEIESELEPDTPETA